HLLKVLCLMCGLDTKIGNTTRQTRKAAANPTVNACSALWVASWCRGVGVRPSAYFPDVQKLTPLEAAKAPLSQGYFRTNARFRCFLLRGTFWDWSSRNCPRALPQRHCARRTSNSRHDRRGVLGFRRRRCCELAVYTNLHCQHFPGPRSGRIDPALQDGDR